jgi:adenylate cyclase
MTQVIFEHNGTIDKYVGDMIMAFWGAPIENEQHRTNAIEAALEMQRKSTLLNQEFEKKGFPKIQIGIGLNTGPMNVGDMGSKFRRAYTVLGDAVNLASRLEGLTKFYDVKIAVGENVKENQTKFLFRLLDRVKVKGRQKTLEVYEVIDYLDKATAEIREEVELHHSALNHYFNSNWQQAKAQFSELKIKYPNKFIYALFLKRIHHYENHPPQQDWDGAYVWEEK